MPGELTSFGSRRRRPSNAWHLLAVITGCALFFVGVRPSPTRNFGVILDGAPEARRHPAGPRLSSGLTWGRSSFWCCASAGETDARADRLRIGVYSVLDATRGETSAPARHAAGLAFLLKDDPVQGAMILRAAVKESPNALLWSDLGAAEYAVAVRTNDPARLSAALVAVDSALRLDADLPPALYNRALILERFGLQPLALAAWQKVLSVESDAGRAAEAGEHERALLPVPAFEDLLTRDYERLAADPAAACAFARRFPQDARTFGLTEILARWAIAETAHDEVTVAKHLRLARSFGESVAHDEGDGMLLAAVEAIDRADSPRRARLAAGHRALHDAQAAFVNNKSASAAEGYVQATAALSEGGSPVALMSRGQTANALFDLGKVAEARSQFEALLAAAPPEFPAYRAQLQWNFGRITAIEGRWGEALSMLNASIAEYERLREPANTAAVREIVSEIYDSVGDPVSAWRERMLVFRALGSRITRRLQIALTAMTRAAAARGEWADAASFLDLELQALRHGGTPARRAEIYLMAAGLHRRAGDLASARNDLAEARATITRLNDPGLSSYLGATALAMEATLASTPRESVRLSSAAIDDLTLRGRRILLPPLYLDRGRAYLALGDRTSAAADFEAAIHELESGRESLPQGEGRLGVFDASRELFEEATSLALAQGTVDAAFHYCERSRARQLLDTLGVSWPSITPADVPSDTAVVEYLALPNRLLIFVYGPSGVAVREVMVDRSLLAADTARFMKAIEQNDEPEVKAASETLHRWLIAPIVSEIGFISNVVVVPDQTLATLSFPALYDATTNQYLIERYRIAVNPSAAVFARLTHRVAVPRRARRLLVVANPSLLSEDYPSLHAAEREATRIERWYGHITTLKRQAATIAGFQREAPRATVIHFGGHAIAGGGRNTALLFSPSGNGDGRFDARQIAAMRLEGVETVVLAACDTARGEIRPSEGTLSIARAFIAAGVSSVVATLQPAGDEEAEAFFPRFHQLLASGRSPAEALRTVQVEWIHRPGRHVGTWAMVQLIGADGR